MQLWLVTTCWCRARTTQNAAGDNPFPGSYRAEPAPCLPEVPWLFARDTQSILREYQRPFCFICSSLNFTPVNMGKRGQRGEKILLSSESEMHKVLIFCPYDSRPCQQVLRSFRARTTSLPVPLMDAGCIKARNQPCATKSPSTPGRSARQNPGSFELELPA